MPSPILARADALMQRRRQNQAEGEEVPVLTDAIEDDIPTLTEAEPWSEVACTPNLTQEAPPENPAADATLAAPAAPDAPPLASSSLDHANQEQQLHEIVQRVEQRLAVELPRLIASILRDVLAEQERDDNAR